MIPMVIMEVQGQEGIRTEDSIWQFLQKQTSRVPQCGEKVRSTQPCGLR